MPVYLVMLVVLVVICPALTLQQQDPHPTLLHLHPQPSSSSSSTLHSPQVSGEVGVAGQRQGRTLLTGLRSLLSRLRGGTDLTEDNSQEAAGATPPLTQFYPVPQPVYLPSYQQPLYQPLMMPAPSPSSPSQPFTVVVSQPTPVLVTHTVTHTASTPNWDWDLGWDLSWDLFPDDTTNRRTTNRQTSEEEKVVVVVRPSRSTSHDITYTRPVSSTTHVVISQQDTSRNQGQAAGHVRQDLNHLKDTMAALVEGVRSSTDYLPSNSGNNIMRRDPWRHTLYSYAPRPAPAPHPPLYYHDTPYLPGIVPAVHTAERLPTIRPLVNQYRETYIKSNPSPSFMKTNYL
ncbi:hypothetical protein Pcinc_043213 [Petrolisthes cinctipes]|uniref:Uncharacterized protein n=1 Tax=Petrolisthes cinctipes TaxID=88211 RepID=A0AAE1BGE4_PETCI|nr:hypothetical protein Pcinc_043213 [Petrolisthes cinctipes]